MNFNLKDVCFLFQFYLSSIKRLFSWFFLEPVAMFQFYLSSIKRGGRETARPISFSFNSTLVQLKVEEVKRGQDDLIMFQFYLSSIKSRKMRPRIAW